MSGKDTMGEKQKQTISREQLFRAGAVTAVPFVILLLAAPPLYGMNDDLQIASVLSGAYSGTPDLHTVYLRAPLSFLLSLLYRILPMLPWFGIFLCATVLLCAFLLLRSVAAAGKDESSPALRYLPVIVMIWLFLLPLFWRLHYTMVAACAGATALFLLLSGSRTETTRERIRQLLPPMGLLLLCDQIRSQVFFLLLPFLCAALLNVFLREEGGIRLKKELPLWGVFAAVWLVLFGLHALAYDSADWQAYLKLNRARTDLYDFTLVWESDEARAFYGECGVTDTAYPLYRRYDLLPDATVTAERLEQMASFREPSRAVSDGQKLKNVLYDLRTRTLKMQGNSDFPYAYILLLLYGIAAVTFLKEKKYRFVLLLAGCGCMHVVIYGWLLWRGRAPERVTLSLYMAEIFLLLAMLRKTSAREKAEGRKEERAGWRSVCLVPAVIMLLALIPVSSDAYVGYREQTSVNKLDDVVYSYMAQHPQELFLLETSAAVNRTAPVFRRNDTERNMMLLGGWLYGSPLQVQKLRTFGYADAQEVFAKEGVALVFESNNPLLLWQMLEGTESRSWVGLEPWRMECFLQERYGLRLIQEDAVGNEASDLQTAGAKSGTFAIYRTEKQ